MLEVCMQETRFTGVYRVADLGHGRYRHLVADTDTGEIIGQWHTGAPEVMQEQGASACLCEIMQSREVADNGECYYLSVPDGDRLRQIGMYWRARGEPSKHGKGQTTGGQAEYAKVYVGAIRGLAAKLEPAEIGVTAMIAASLDRRKGYSVDAGGQPVTTLEQLAGAINCPLRTLERHIKRLRDMEIIKRDAEGRFFIAPHVAQK
jgi:hypothetical protein